MYAIIANGGKQYKVAVGETLKLESLEADVGAAVEFPEVLLVADGEDIKIGTPLVKNAKVIGEVVEHGRGDKVHIIKFRRRKHYMKHQGHRQNYTAVKFTEIKSK